MSDGLKYDKGKPPVVLLPPYAIEELAKVLGMGADKYGARNWLGVENYRDRYLSAALRHIIEMMKGNNKDEESGLLHAAHAMASLAFIIDIEAGPGQQPDGPPRRTGGLAVSG